MKACMYARGLVRKDEGMHVHARARVCTKHEGLRVRGCAPDREQMMNKHLVAVLRRVHSAPACV
jgi:hypothetical protein